MVIRLEKKEIDIINANIPKRMSQEDRVLVEFLVLAEKKYAAWKNAESKAKDNINIPFQKLDQRLDDLEMRVRAFGDSHARSQLHEIQYGSKYGDSMQRDVNGYEHAYHTTQCHTEAAKESLQMLKDMCKKLDKFAVIDVASKCFSAIQEKSTLVKDSFSRK